MPRFCSPSQELADEKVPIANIGASMPVGPGVVRVSYVNANASGHTPAGASLENNDASQLAVGYVYDLSKRTALYSSVAARPMKAVRSAARLWRAGGTPASEIGSASR